MATLIAAGHRLADIRTYTMKQLQGFVELAMSHDRIKLESMGSMNRAAYHADKKQWVQVMKELKELDNG